MKIIIKPVARLTVATHCTGTIKGLSAAQISKILGMKPTDVNPHEKTVNEWKFTADCAQFAIWDYRGSEKQKEYSTYGSSTVLAQLFGSHYIESRVGLVSTRKLNGSH